MPEKKSSVSAGAIVAGIAGLTAAAVGAYYLYGHKEAEKNRAKVKGWMLKAKGEVLEQLESVQDVTESAYMSAIDTVSKKYQELKHIDPAELGTFMNEMKDHWNGIKGTIEGATKKPAAKKPSKAKAAKPAKKAAKK